MHPRAINDWRGVPEIKTDEQAVEMFGPTFRGVVSAAEKMGGRAAIYVVGVDLASGPDRTGVVLCERDERAGEPRVVGDGSCCGVAPGARHYETCPHVVAWKASRCGAKPARGQRIGRSGDDLTLATGDEECANGNDCNGRHEADFGRLTWTAAPMFLDCAVCASRVMPYDGGPVLYSAKDAGKNRVGTICEACRGTLDSASWPLMVWRGDRLVRKDVASGMEQRLTVSGRELDAWGAVCGVPRKAGEPDDEYRPRVLRGFYREMSSPLGLRTATAREQTRAKVLAELTREGTTRPPERRKGHAMSGEEDENPFCSGPPECVHCTPIGLLCDHKGLMPAEDEAHERGADVAEVIAAREEATTP